MGQADEQAPDYDVLVIGAGPTGAVLALALAQAGVTVLMISKHSGPTTAPGAHITNQRAMEVYRDLGVEGAITNAGTPWDLMGDMLFATSLTGDEIVRLRTWGSGPQRHGEYLQASPCGMLDLPQNKLEPLLVEAAIAAGAHVKYGTEYLSLKQDEREVTARLFDRENRSERQLRAHYVIGADGANSKVASDIGLPIEGEMAQAGTIYARFRANLQALVEHRPSTLYWILSTAADRGEIGMGLLRAVDPWREWIAGWAFDIDAGQPNLSVEHAERRIRDLVGDPDLDVEVMDVSPWFINRAYATEYRVGRVLCAGDAVHRHPPSSGLGSNTCVQDAHNLAWKLAYVIKGWAKADLLDSYCDERAPVGLQVVQRAVASRAEYAPLRAALSVPDAADPLAAGLRRIVAPDAAGAEAREALRRAIALKNYEFNAHGVELNIRYSSNAVLRNSGASPERFTDRQLYAQPSSEPGAKVPHAWLVDELGTRISTLDKVGRHRITLLTGLAGSAWATAAESLRLPYLRTVVIGSGDARDLYFEWATNAGVDETTAYLIRPDGYIAWCDRSAPESAASARHRLADALSALLGVQADPSPMA